MCAMTCLSPALCWAQRRNRAGPGRVPRLVREARAPAGQGWKPRMLGNARPPDQVGRRGVFIAGILEEAALGLTV